MMVSLEAIINRLVWFENWVIIISGGGGWIDLESGYGDVRPRRPVFTQGSHFQHKRLKLSSQDSLWENLKFLASTSSIFAQILALNPPNLKISVHKTPLSEAKTSSQAPCWKSGLHTPT